MSTAQGPLRTDENDPPYMELPFSQLEELCRELVLPLPAKLSAIPADVPVRVSPEGRCWAVIGEAEISLLHGESRLWPPASRLMWQRLLLATGVLGRAA